MDIYLINDRERAGEHHGPRDYIHGDARGFRLLEKEKLRNKSEYHAAPAEQKHNGAANFIVVTECDERTGSCRTCEQDRNYRVVNEPGGTLASPCGRP